jgi:hypothetical protein
LALPAEDVALGAIEVTCAYSDADSQSESKQITGCPGR